MLLIDFGVLSIQELTDGRCAQASRTELGYLLCRVPGLARAEDAFVVVIIDEAQNLSLPLIEETRILSDTLRRPGPAANRVRRAARTPRQVEAAGDAAGRSAGLRLPSPGARSAARRWQGYIQHRLQRGWRRDSDRVLFPPERRRPSPSTLAAACRRLVNRVCDRALQLAYERQAEAVEQRDPGGRVDRGGFHDAVADVGFDHLRGTASAAARGGRTVPKPASTSEPAAGSCEDGDAASPAPTSFMTRQFRERDRPLGRAGISRRPRAR